MHGSYEDITSRIATAPLWFDEHAVPRYCEFSPDHSASIYVNEVALVEISCSGCGKLMSVAMSALNHADGTIADGIRDGTLHFGDPPRHQGRPDENGPYCVGNTMGSDPKRVLEYWHRAFDKRYVVGDRITDVAYFDWNRDPSLEQALTPNWERISSAD